jgi:hypothetical protein
MPVIGRFGSPSLLACSIHSKALSRFPASWCSNARVGRIERRGNFSAGVAQRCCTAHRLTVAAVGVTLLHRVDSFCVSGPSRPRRARRPPHLPRPSATRRAPEAGCAAPTTASTISSAARTSPPCWYRRAGSFSRQRVTTVWSTAAPRDGSGAGASFTTAALNASPVWPANGRPPVAISDSRKRLHDPEMALAGGGGVVAAHELVVQAL